MRQYAHARLPGGRKLLYNTAAMVRTVRSFASENTVLLIAASFALLSAFIVPPDAQYLQYIDFKTVSCLFSTLAAICALRNIRFFTMIARKIVSVAGNLKAAVLLLLYITFIGSMLIANDMALITFLPLGYIILKETNQERHAAFVFILQNISANLGGMLTPFGNPQNLFLHSKFSIPVGEFLGIMAPPFLVSIVMLTLCILFLPSANLELDTGGEELKMKGKGWVYIALFCLAILGVFNMVHYLIVSAVIIAVLMVMDRKALKEVDYPLLATFVAFFIFAGNVSRIEAVGRFVSPLADRFTMLFSSLSCQLISNVPSAILLSQFTDNYRSLLLGVNIGGTGTLIASLASLITFRAYTSRYPDKTKKYLGLFFLMNFAFLAVLICFELILGYR